MSVSQISNNVAKFGGPCDYDLYFPARFVGRGGSLIGESEALSELVEAKWFRVDFSRSFLTH